MYVYDDSIWWLEREAGKPGTSTHLVMLLQLIKDEPKRTAEAVAKSARETPALKVLQDIINAWDENEIGQVDGELIETARKALEEMGMK